MRRRAILERWVAVLALAVVGDALRAAASSEVGRVASIGLDSPFWIPYLLPLLCLAATAWVGRSARRREIGNPDVGARLILLFAIVGGCGPFWSFVTVPDCLEWGYPPGEFSGVPWRDVFLRDVSRALAGYALQAGVMALFLLPELRGALRLWREELAVEDESSGDG